MDFEAARQQMIHQQVRAWDVLDPTVLQVLGRVPRERFVPPAFRELAFADSVFHDFRSGNYHVTVWALNGGWKRGIDIIRNAGNVHGAIGLFGEKYGAVVKVYTMGDVSKEICGGPHAEHTGALGAFKIQ